MKLILSAVTFALLSSSCSMQSTENDVTLNTKNNSERHVEPHLVNMAKNSVNKRIARTTSLPKNIIMVVGDGMGPAYTSAYRYYNDNPSTATIEQTVFDRHLTGSSSTYPAAISGVVTDSAASATALATGVKSYNGAIGVDADKNKVQTVLEWAKLQGKKTGVVVTSQINHATPASYLAHNESRKNYNQIADSYLDDGVQADLYFGGGWHYFIRDDRNLVNEFQQAGFHYLDNYQDLATIPKNKPVLGLFADVGLPAAIDDSDPQRLATLSKRAIHHLIDLQKHDQAKDNGFFMLIEASQIDWAGHSNDINNAMAEMDDLAKTLEYLEHFVKHHPDTLVVVTADHSTGGFTLGAKGKYAWQPAVLKSLTSSAHSIANTLYTQKITPALTEKLFKFSLTDDELTLLKANKKITADQKKSIVNPTKVGKHKHLAVPEFALQLAVKRIIDQRSNTGWTSGGHTAVDVPVFAFGKHSSHFNGLQDNTDIAKKLFKLLGK